MACVLDGPPLIDALLAEQQCSAVESFARWHHDHSAQPRTALYRDLIPLSLPAPGEQYAFQVDLDACTGCQACVAACHRLNGLEEGESWRFVGLLHGGTSQLPVIQHVTTACHHCLEPACLAGCPVHAYEKDPITGIVRHLDDQCIGCQYCILQCPYDVPKYSFSKGIVRKCDMCHGRLTAGQAPACVQACPNQAIRIMVVSHEQIREESEANLFLPGAPEPGYTLPATIYKTGRPLPRNLLPADYYSVGVQHAHLPLVLMLVLTQMSVGALAVDQLLGWLPARRELGVLSEAWAIQSTAALLLGIVGLAASVLHLGRPKYAFRAILGLRTSWLSREILAFGIFALLALLYSALPWAPIDEVRSSGMLRRAVGGLAVASGLAGVVCSVLIYASTRRPFWSGPRTGLKFFLTAAILGLPTALLIWLAAAASLQGLTLDTVMRSCGASMCAALVVLTGVKLLVEAWVFVWLRGRQFSPLKRTALLMTGELGPVALQRFALGLAGGIVLPAVLAGPYLRAPAASHDVLFLLAAAGLSVILLLAGELLERYLFFAAVVAPKMPGAPAS